MEKLDNKILKEIIGDKNVLEEDVYNIRKNGKCVARKDNPNISIVSKENNKGLDIYVKENTLFGVIHIPVIITESGLKDVVENDFHIGKNSNIVILSGCGVHNPLNKESEHDGIHRFYLEAGAKVKYIEKHYAEGKGTGKKILSPTTEIYLEENASLTMDTIQIKGVDYSERKTYAKLKDKSTLTITEKIMTCDDEKAITDFKIDLEGNNASCHVTSRSVATDSSYQEFHSNVVGYNKCYAHVECDAIIKDAGKIRAIPEIYAKNVDANLIHEAAIGKIAKDQLAKLMSLGLAEKEAENAIIEGFLK